jgi:hypothetical protein
VATLDVRYFDRARAVAGVIGKASGPGVACFATHPLWANWITGEPTYVALHDALCGRRPAVELLGEGFWPPGLCATATADGLAVWNGTAEGAGADVLAHEAGHALYTASVCAYSAQARRPDGMRSGETRVSVWVAPESVVWCRRLPVLVQPYEGSCLAQLLEAEPGRLALRLGGDGAAATTNADGSPEVGEGEPVEVRLTVRSGAYPVAPGSAHVVTVRRSSGAESKMQLTATADGELRLDVMADWTTVTLTPAGGQGL